MENLIINNKNYGTFIIDNNILILTSDSRKIISILPQGLVKDVQKRMILNHDGTRNDRNRAFEQNDYIQKGFTITIDLQVLNFI